MSGLVLKKWHIDSHAENGDAITIVGREGGLLAWILALMGIDPTTSIRVDADRVEFTSVSLSGMESRMLPLQGICSTYYGYYKPWKAALGILIAMLVIGYSSHSFGMLVLFLLLGLAGAGVYYFLNRTLTLGFVEQSGVVNGIKFKRSVIENVDINAEQAKEVCKLIQTLIELKEKENRA